MKPLSPPSTVVVEPTISIIIPVHNSEATLADCLTSVTQAQPSPLEIIVVDDGSTDSSADIAEKFPCRLIKLHSNRGAAAARNHAARSARGAILFFIDADIRAEPDTLRRIAAAFRAQPSLSALFGSYRRDAARPNFFSDYKNLMHHYTHQTSSPNAITFCSGYGAVRRQVFETFGGFDESRRALEDIEFGYRLHQAGHPIRLEKDLQFTHLKRYTFSSLVTSDFFNRAIPWTGLMLEKHIFRNDLNTRSNNVASVGLAFLSVGAPLIAGRHSVGAWIAAASCALFIILNRDFFRFIWRARGPVFLLPVIAMHWFYYLYSGIGFVIGVLIFLQRARHAG